MAAPTITVLDSSGNVQTISKPTALSAGINFQTAPIVPVIQNAAYALGNCAGGLQTVSFFRAASNFSALLTGLSALWLGAEVAPLNFYVFNKNPASSTFTDKSTFSIANADASQLVAGPITITPAAMPGAAQTMGTVSLNISTVNQDTSPGQNLYVAIEVGAAVTPAVGDLVFWLNGLLD